MKQRCVARSAQGNSPVVAFDTAKGKQQRVWAEVTSKAANASLTKKVKTRQISTKDNLEQLQQEECKLTQALSARQKQVHMQVAGGHHDE